MDYVYCGGYKTVLLALYMKKILKKEIVIVTYSDDVVEFCKTNKINYIQIKQFRPHITSVFKLLIFKKLLDNTIKTIDLKKEDNFFVTSKVIAYELFYLAKELSKKGNIYFARTMRELDLYKPPRFIYLTGLINKIIIKIVLDLDTVYYNSNNDPRIGIDDNFFKKYNIEEYIPDLEFEELIFEAVKKTKMEYKSHDNLIVDSGIVDQIIKSDSERLLYKNLFDLPLKFAFKKCPKSHENNAEREKADEVYYSIFKNCEELPRHLPVEFYFNNIKKNVISVFSTALITASKFDHLKAISMLELVDWYNKSYKEEFKDHLIIESKNKIIFPNSFEELKDILLNS